MGTTLQNGVYLPNEGERNCYAGLKTNWEILDQKVADVTALQQAVAGALHREIVASLPTTDIDPNTIYMILSGTSATENVYNEFMYVNNAWELIGTSATDLTNYYTKGDVDGLLLLKANASDLTSHTGDTTIHVTSADKTKWNTVALIKQLRLVNAQVGSATTIAFANIDDTNGIKVGDKCMDLDAKMFEITAVDTTNQTVTVSSALIDLALDANVVHTSGDETVGGQKTFANNRIIVGRNTDASSAIQLVNSDVVGGSTTGASGLEVYGSSVSTDNKIGGVTVGEWSNNGGSYASIECNRTVSDVKTSNTIRNLIRNDGSKEFSAGIDNDCKLGHPYFRWSEVYATNYYYGANNVEFSTKFVTTDTAQTVSGAKTFSDNLTIYNSDNTQTPKGLAIRNAQWGMGESGGTTTSSINFLDKNYAIPAAIIASKGSSGQSFLRFSVRTKNSQNNSYSEEIYFNVDMSENVTFRPWHDNTVNLGASIYRWKDVQTYKVNGLEPSSLSLPGYTSSRIDISSYITNLTGGNNNYTAPANGYIFVRTTNGTYIELTEYPSGVCSSVCSQTADDIGTFIPVLSGRICIIAVKCSSIDRAYFIPCLGNI